MGFVDTAAAINTKVCQEDLGTQADCWKCKKDGDGKKIRGGDRTLDRFPILVPRSSQQGQSLPSRLQCFSSTDIFEVISPNSVVHFTAKNIMILACTVHSLLTR